MTKSPTAKPPQWSAECMPGTKMARATEIRATMPEHISTASFIASADRATLPDFLPMRSFVVQRMPFKMAAPRRGQRRERKRGYVDR